jgi:hypothetical protein
MFWWFISLCIAVAADSCICWETASMQMITIKINKKQQVCTAGSKYLEYNPGSESNLFLLNNEQ